MECYSSSLSLSVRLRIQWYFFAVFCWLFNLLLNAIKVHFAFCLQSIDWIRRIALHQTGNCPWHCQQQNEVGGNGRGIWYCIRVFIFPDFSGFIFVCFLFFPAALPRSFCVWTWAILIIFYVNCKTVNCIKRVQQEKSIFHLINWKTCEKERQRESGRERDKGQLCVCVCPRKPEWQLAIGQALNASKAT